MYTQVFMVKVMPVMPHLQAGWVVASLSGTHTSIFIWSSRVSVQELRLNLSHSLQMRCVRGC